MTYHDDEDDHAPPRAVPPGQAAPRGDFRADPSLNPRAGYPPLTAGGGYAPPPPPVDPEPVYVDPAAAAYRHPAAEPSLDAQGYAYPAGQSPQQAQDAYYQGYEQQHYVPPPRRRNLVNIGIFAGAIIVFGGIIFYAYNQGMRAGTESVAPILRADTSPTKIRPEQPGGMEVPHQDKLVYDRLNPNAAAAPGEVERLLPPPEAPMERPRAAVPADEMMPLAEEGEGQVGALPPSDEPTSPIAPPPQPLPQQQQQPVPTYAPPLPQPQQQQATASSQAPQSLLPPAPRPATSPVVTPPKPAATVAALPAVKPAAGGAAVRIQVAAVDSEAKAATEWQRLQRKFPADLGGMTMRTVRVQLPKGIFYRIQGGPVDEARAKQICATMAAQGAGCSIVR